MRPADWSAVDLATDPVPGDPAALERGGHEYTEIARAISRTSSRLRSLGLDGEVSEAVDALAETARTVADDISRAHARYDATGTALLEYSRALSDAQTESLDALYSAQAAQQAAVDAADDERRYLRLSADAADPSAALRYETLAGDALSAAAFARGRIADAQRRIRDAEAVRDAAADRAIDRIRNTTSGDDLNDSWWDNWGADALAVLTDVAGWVAAIAGVLALAVSWIPVIGQALAAALLLVAGIAAIVNAIGNVVLASTGDRSWTEAVISIVGAALAVVGLGGAARVVGAAVARGAASASARTGAALATPVRGVGAAGRHARTVLGARSRINALATAQAGWKGERLTVLEALRLKPSTLAESETLWTTPLRAPSNGDEVYRLFGTPEGVPVGQSARAGGASYSPTPPWELSAPRELLGLPDVNAADNLIIAEVTDASKNVLTRHALPLDGMPGGAPEYIFPGPFGDGKGLEILDSLTFAIR